MLRYRFLLLVALCCTFLLAPTVAAAKDSFFHVDIAAVGALNMMYGLKNKSLMPGGTVTPELRFRFGNDDTQFFITPFGYAAVNGFINAKSASEIKSTERTLYGETSIYHSLGFAFKITEDSTKPGISCGFNHFVAGVGFANQKIRDAFDNGPFIYFGFSTNALSFNF